MTRIVLDTLPIQGPALALYQSSRYVETHRAARDGILLVFLEKSLR